MAFNIHQVEADTRTATVIQKKHTTLSKTYRTHKCALNPPTYTNIDWGMIHIVWGYWYKKSKYRQFLHTLLWSTLWLCRDSVLLGHLSLLQCPILRPNSIGTFQHPVSKSYHLPSLHLGYSDQFLSTCNHTSLSMTIKTKIHMFLIDRQIISAISHIKWQASPTDYSGNITL